MALLGDLATSLPDGHSGDSPAGPAAPLAFPQAVVARADAVLTDAALASPCVEAAGRHACTASALVSVLTLARAQAGVLALAGFNFLKLTLTVAGCHIMARRLRRCVEARAVQALATWLDAQPQLGRDMFARG